MKLTTILPFVAITTAFVIPDERMTAQIVEAEQHPKSFFDKLPSKSDISSFVEEKIHDAVDFSENALDAAINAATEVGEKAQSSFQCHKSMTAFDAQAWIDSSLSTVEDVDISEQYSIKPHKPRHGHHDHKPNMTIYELISKSKYTTKLAKLINKFPEFVEKLNGTESNFTIFAPIDAAFEKIGKIPKDKRPSDEMIAKVLMYHVSPDSYSAARVLASHTIPSVLKLDSLGDEAQRLRLGLSLRGLTVNFYSRVVAVNIFGTNGVIHGVDSLILPPPPAIKILEILPAEFSTLDLGLEKTGLASKLATAPHQGGTFFAPSNNAFARLGPKINAFLFSSYGEKYLKALLKYHIVANQTLYSDAFYKVKDSEVNAANAIDEQDISKGFFHVDLPTLLDDKSLSIDVARYGGLISMKINGFGKVAVQDGIAKDGVIHVVGNVLIPPKTPGGMTYQGEDMSVEDFKERFDGFIEEEIRGDL